MTNYSKLCTFSCNMILTPLLNIFREAVIYHLYKMLIRRVFCKISAFVHLITCLLKVYKQIQILHTIIRIYPNRQESFLLSAMWTWKLYRICCLEKDLRKVFWRHKGKKCRNKEYHNSWVPVVNVAQATNQSLCSNVLGACALDFDL